MRPLTQTMTAAEAEPAGRIRFVLNGAPAAPAPDVPAATILLDWLRGPAGLTGAKEGCAQGDCGACTVVLEGADGSRTPINACLAMLGQMHGRTIRTVEGLGGPGGLDGPGGPHPLQRALAEGDATQCGFCTPGFVMAAWAHGAGAHGTGAHGAGAQHGGAQHGGADARMGSGTAAGAHADADRAELHDALAGNLCRCTGYRPILDAVAGLAAERGDAAGQVPGAPSLAPVSLPAGSLSPGSLPPGSRATGSLAPEPGVADGPGDAGAASPSARFEADGRVFHLPAGMDALLALRAALPDATLLAGGTDLGLLASEHRALPRTVLCLLGVPELAGLEPAPGGLRVGAAVSCERLLGTLEAHPGLGLLPFAALLRRLGSRQIRGLGTLGGNCGTASPIGDALPPLLALGATLRLRSVRGAREMAVEAFLLDYRRTALAPDEVIESVWLPSPPADSVFACEKLSKRPDQDIATVGASLLVELADGRVRLARLAFGGMGPLPVRAAGAEAALTGATWSHGALERAAAALATDLAPLSDWRGSAGYRQAAAAGLLRRLWWRATRPDLPLDVHALASAVAG